MPDLDLASAVRDARNIIDSQDGDLQTLMLMHNVVYISYLIHRLTGSLDPDHQYLGLRLGDALRWYHRGRGMP